MSSTKLSKQTLTPTGAYSPVELPESPASASSSRNLTGLPRVVRDCVADIYNNIQQWNSLHIRGAIIVKEIALLKSDSKKLYPTGLETLSLSLYEAVQAQKIIVDNLETCMKQLKSVVHLHKSVIPMFISWSTDKMFAIGEHIFQAYNKEFKLKEFISENICHVQGKDKLMFYAASWTYQPYITKEVNLELESFLKETGHRKNT